MASDRENRFHNLTHMNHPTANLALNRKHLHKMLEPEKKVLLELRKLHFETAQFEIELHRSIFAIEEGTDPEYHKIYEERKNILQQFRGVEEDKINSNRPLRRFWLRVLRAADIEINAEKDEKILHHLIDVRSKMYVEPRVKMVIEFEFEENEYFSNKLLTKTYFIKCDADPKDAIIYDGIEITSMEGCKINWLVERDGMKEHTTEDNQTPSFFEYFNDHSDNENLNRALLSEEIAFGFFLREKVIPKAVYFFTGEIRGEKEENSDESERESVEGDTNANEEDVGDDDDDERTETCDDEIYETCSERPEDDQDQEQVQEQELHGDEDQDEQELDVKVRDVKYGEVSQFKDLAELEEELLELIEEPEYEDAIADEALCMIENTADMDKELKNNEENAKNEMEEKNENTRNLLEETKDENMKFIETVEDLAKHVMVSENICLRDSKSFLRVSESTTRKLTITEEMSRVASRALLEEKVKSEFKKD